MSISTVHIADLIQRWLPAPVQFVIAVVLLSVNPLGPFGLDLPLFLSAGTLIAGIGLLGTSMMPLFMIPFDASEWDELSGGARKIVLSMVTVVILGMFVAVGLWLLL